MKELLRKNINIGVVEGLTKSEEKRVKLLNFICLIWYGVTVLFIITDYFIVEEYAKVLLGYFFQVTLFIVVQYLQHLKKYVAARVLFVTLSHLLVFMFATVIIPGNFVDLFYILTPMFSLMFFENKKLHYFYLLLAILSFVFPTYWWETYPPGLFSDPVTIPIFFVSIFLLVNYFKNLNLKSEAILKKQKKELEEVYNFQNQFFVNIAHEIRTPITIIKGNINKLSNENIDITNTLKTQTKKIQRIVNDVIDLTKMDSNDFFLNLEEIEISPFISKIFNSFHLNFQNKSINYQLFDTTNDCVIIKADKLYLESAISNVLTNALKYTKIEEDVSVIIEQTNENVIIKIKDTGIGIEEKEIEKVFKRFYQSDNSINRAGGSGIGLAFSKEIIQKHKGKIEIESKKDVGSSFIITLPIYDFKSKNRVFENTPIEENILVSNPFAKDKKTILLVEDNNDMQVFISEVLSSYNIIEAVDGLEGLEKLNNHKIDYIITDYMMPNMNGAEFVKTVKNKNVTTPILMLTAKSDAKIEMLRLGIDDYITKPFEDEELLLRIEHGLNNYANQQRYIETEKIPNSETIQDNVASKLLKDLTVFIETNCTKEKFGVVDLCEEFAMSKSTLYRKIKSLTGLNSQEFITEVRLLKAKEIMINNEFLSFKEVGYRIGFSNYNHFKKLFEKRFGSVDS